MYGWCLAFRFPNAHIEIKDNVTINSSFFSNFIGLYQRTIMVARDNGKISIGNNVGMSGVTIYARDEVTIDDYTTIGANTKIFDNDFHSLDAEESSDCYCGFYV